MFQEHICNFTGVPKLFPYHTQVVKFEIVALADLDRSLGLQAQGK